MNAVLPAPPFGPDTPDLRRWWSKVDVRLEGCCPWTGRRTAKGYGQFDVGPHAENEPVLAHRWGYQQLVGPVDPDEGVRHFVCDNPPCCRIAHLMKGTQADNVHDMLAHGRRADTHGERNPRRKLTEAQVAEIRLRYALGNVTQSLLGQTFGVTQRTISYIVRGDTWMP